MRNDDERISHFRYVMSKYGTTTPTNLQLRKNILAELQYALDNGQGTFK